MDEILRAPHSLFRVACLDMPARNPSSCHDEIPALVEEPCQDLSSHNLDFPEEPELVEIEYRPWKKIVIHEVKELPPKDFFEGLAAAAEAQKQGTAPVVNWADGIAFVFQLFPDSDRVLGDKMEGVIHYNTVQFTRTSFQSEKRATIGGRDHIIKLVKGDSNVDFMTLANFLNGLKPLEPSP